MSLAPFWIADISIRLTSRMTGASPPCFSSDDDVDLLDLLEHLDVVVVDVARGLLERAGDHLERRRVIEVRRLLLARLPSSSSAPRRRAAAAPAPGSSA